MNNKNSCKNKFLADGQGIILLLAIPLALVMTFGIQGTMAQSDGKYLSYSAADPDGAGADQFPEAEMAIRVDAGPGQMAGQRDARDAVSEVIDTRRHIRAHHMEEALAQYERQRGIFLSPPLGFETSFEPTTPEELGRIRVLTLPHHIPGAGLNIHGLQALANQEFEPTAFILLGPNHGNTGPATATTLAHWQTDFGLVKPQEAMISQLIDQRLATPATSALAEEHSLGMIIPWLAYYFPETPITPLIFHYRFSMEELAKLLVNLHPWLEAGAVLIISVDFSHNQNRDGALARDIHTQYHMASSNWQAIAKLDSNHLDCPTLVATALRYGQEQGFADPALLAWTNSGFLAGITDQEATSYMVWALHEAPPGF